MSAGAPSGPLEPASRAAIRALSDEELQGALARLQYTTVTECNAALIEMLKAGPWLVGGTSLSGFVAGLILAGAWPPTPGRLAIDVAVIALAVMCYGGGHWHQRRAKQRFALARALDPAREALLSEMTRRGL